MGLTLFPIERKNPENRVKNSRIVQRKKKRLKMSNSTLY